MKRNTIWKALKSPPDEIIFCSIHTVSRQSHQIKILFQWVKNPNSCDLKLVDLMTYSCPLFGSRNSKPFCMINSCRIIDTYQDFLKFLSISSGLSYAIQSCLKFLLTCTDEWGRVGLRSVYRGFCRHTVPIGMCHWLQNVWLSCTSKVFHVVSQICPLCRLLPEETLGESQHTNLDDWKIFKLHSLLGLEGGGNTALG